MEYSADDMHLVIGEQTMQIKVLEKVVELQREKIEELERAEKQNGEISDTP